MTKEQLAVLQKFTSQKYQKTKQINLESLCFGKQLNFINDKSRFVTAVTSRRAGKTTACALHLLDTALKHPNSTNFYITYARVDAKGIVWPMLHQLNRELDLKGDFNESDLTYRLSNGAMIRLGGAATAAEIDRFRGYAVKLAYVDESQRLQGYVENLVNDVLVPACFDNKGQIRLIGTPGHVPVGFFYEASNSKQFSNHHWTIFDNPWIEKKSGTTAQVILEEELARRGVSIDDPTIQREFFGKWVVDTATLVLNYSKEQNHYDVLPATPLEYIMGIDLGYKDADAIAILGHGSSSPTTYLVDELITTKQGLSELFNQVETLRKLYDPYKIVIDTGGLGLKIAEEMRRRWQIPVEAAEKTRKFENLELLNDSLRTGVFKAKESSRFASDSMILEWDIDKTKPDKKVISSTFHSDIIDSVLYAWKFSPAYTYEKPIEKVKYGSPEWAQKEVEQMEDDALEYAYQQQYLDKEESDYLEWL